MRLVFRHHLVMAASNATRVTPRGLRNSSRRISPGCVGVRLLGSIVLPQSRALELVASGLRSRIDDETPLTLGGKREALQHILAGELGERLEQVFHGYACGWMSKHLADRDSRALDARLAEANRRIDRGSCERRYGERVAPV